MGHVQTAPGKTSSRTDWELKFGDTRIGARSPLGKPLCWLGPCHPPVWTPGFSPSATRYKPLAARPGQWAPPARQPPRLVKFTIDEALRYESPFQSFFRTVATDTIFRSIPLPAGSKALLCRNAGSHLAFGMGIHQRVGKPISRLQMDVLFTAMAKRISTIEPTAEPLPYLHTTLRGWSSIPLKITRLHSKGRTPR